MSGIDVLIVVGTRPEIIKMAPVYHALKDANIKTEVLHTGQHTGLATPIYKVFDITPDHHINLLSKKKGADAIQLSRRFARILTKCAEQLDFIKPRAVLVHGDTLTAHAAAMAAFFHGIPVGHVEAGLRTHNIYDPFPEEENRQAIARMATWHFCPTENAYKNLLQEGIKEEQMHMTGNTVIDALSEVSFSSPSNSKIINRKLKAFLGGDKLHILVTMHRRENIPNNLKTLFHNLVDVVRKRPDVHIIWPIHMNPKVRDTITELEKELSGKDKKQLLIWSPLDYIKLLFILRGVWLVVTDSGGIQEEAAAFNKPIIIARKNTERPEVITTGKGLLVPPHGTNIADAIFKLLEDKALYKKMQNSVNPYGDGRASVRIVKVLEEYLLKDAA